MLIGVGGLRGQAMRGGEQGPEGPGLVLLRAPPPEPPHPVLYSGGHRGSGPRRTLLPGNSVGGGGLWDDSSVLYSLGTLFLLLPRQLHRRSPGIRPLTLGTPG